MNFREAEKYLNENFVSFQTAGRKAYREGLESIINMCRVMGDPQRDYLTVHIAGTNGKGSVAHMLASVLQAAGYKTGLYTSPHLESFRERIRVDGEPVSEEGVAEFMTAYGEVMKQLELSYFEMTTAMAFGWFRESGVDVAVIETGLGGRLDATNVIEPVLSVVTNVSVDHSDILGDTRAKIAAEKAGIIKKNIPVVIGRSNPETDPVFVGRAAELNTKAVFADRLYAASECGSSRGSKCFAVRNLGDGSERVVTTDLCGDYQRENVVTVIAAVEQLNRSLKLHIDDDAVETGLRTAALRTGLRARWQVLAQSPLTVVDGGHNPDAVSKIVAQLAREHFEKLFMVIGFSADKDTDCILQMLPREAYYIFTAAGSSRAMAADELSRRAAAFGLCGEIANTAADALAKARQLASENDMIFVGGSLYLAAEVC